MSIVSMAQVVKAAQAANLSNPDLYSIQPGDLSPSKANWHVVKRVFNFISQYDDDEEDDLVKNDHELNYDNIDGEIKRLKNVKTLKLPGYTLQRYVHLVSEKESGQKIDYEFLESVLNRVDINYKTDYGDTALHEACKINESSIKLVKLLIANNANILLANNYGQTIMHMAAVNDNPRLIKYLIETDTSGELIKQKTAGERQAPIHYAAKNGSCDAIVSLVKNSGSYSSKILEVRDHQGRTPLYLAAEYGYSHAVKKLIELGAKVDVSNVFGQKALFWICSKCSDIVSEILDTYLEEDVISRKNHYRLDCIDLEVYVDENGKQKIPRVKSILMYIAENQRLDLIVHPTIEALIQVKWIDFARYRCYFEMLQTLVDLVIWHLLGVLIPYNKKHVYNFPGDWWRLFLFIWAFLGIVRSVVGEIVELRNVSKYQKMAIKQRLQELEGDESYCHPKDQHQKGFLQKEKMMCKRSNTLMFYLTDYWNLYDILCVLLLLTVILTHIADVSSHTEELAKAHNRIFSITLIVISMRIFQMGRVMHQKFGMLVVTLSFTIEKIVVWIVIYFILELSFTSALWMVFGSNENPPDFMSSYNVVIFTVWLATFGRWLDAEQMGNIDPVMSYVLYGMLVGILALILLNVFIALLSSTLSLVMDKAKAYFLLQRLERIIQIEHELPNRFRLQHLNRLKKKFKSSSDSEKLTTSDLTVNIDGLRGGVSDLKEKIFTIKDNMDEYIKKIADMRSSKSQYEELEPEKEEEEPGESVQNKLSLDIEHMKGMLKSKFSKLNRSHQA